MAARNGQHIVIRYTLALMWAVLIGASDHIIEGTLIGPAHGAIAGLFAGLLIRSWFALLFPPQGMILGWVFATLISWGPVWIHPLGWIIALPLSVLTAAIGVLLGRSLESTLSGTRKPAERTEP